MWCISACMCRYIIQETACLPCMDATAAETIIPHVHNLTQTYEYVLSQGPVQYSLCFQTTSPPLCLIPQVGRHDRVMAWPLSVHMASQPSKDFNEISHRMRNSQQPLRPSPSRLWWHLLLWMSTDAADQQAISRERCALSILFTAHPKYKLSVLILYITCAFL